MSAETYVDPTAEVDPAAVIGRGTAIWNWTKVREGARIGADCRIGQNVYIDARVQVGDDCKIQNGVSVYKGVSLGDRVFVGPAVTFTNDRVPRADSPDWQVTETVVADDASLGANSTIICGVRLGRACMVGAGAVVTADVPDHALVVGNPARVVDYVSLDGTRLGVGPDGQDALMASRPS